MSNRKMFHLLFFVAALSALAAGGTAVTACSDSSPPPGNLDGTSDGEPDGPMWPDIWPRKDGLEDGQQPDSYNKSKFGCQTDLDCFGQKCCPTPWGVKLCAPTCFPR